MIHQGLVLNLTARMTSMAQNTAIMAYKRHHSRFTPPQSHLFCNPHIANLPSFRAVRTTIYSPQAPPLQHFPQAKRLVNLSTR